MKRNVVVVLAVAAALCGSAVWSQGPRGGGPFAGPPGAAGPGAGGRGMMMASPAMAVMPPNANMLDILGPRLKLTDEQTAKLRNILASRDKAVRPLMQKSGEATRALRLAVLAATYDAKNVKQLAAKAQNAEAAVVSANIETWSQIRGVLTKSQLTALREVLTSRPRGLGGPRPSGPPPGGFGTPGQAGPGGPPAGGPGGPPPENLEY